MLGLRCRISPGIGVHLTRVVGGYSGVVAERFNVVIGIELVVVLTGWSGIVAGLAAGLGFAVEPARGIGFFRFPSRGFRPAHVCLPCPSASPARGAPGLSRSAHAREILIAWANPTEPSRAKKSRQTCHGSTDARIVIFEPQISASRDRGSTQRPIRPLRPG